MREIFIRLCVIWKISSTFALMKKVILITGASSGFGKASAEYLAQKGYIVYGTGRNPKEEWTNNVRMLKMDVTDPASVLAAISLLLSEQSRIDVVVNNAGMGICGALELAALDDVRLQMETNFMGTVNVCNAVIPAMRAGGGGRIINISSIGGVIGIPFQGYYSASKFAVEGYSETLSLELRPFNIKVCLVEPGDFATNFTDNRKICLFTEKSEHYAKTFERTLEIIEKEERNGGNPLQLAKALNRIIKTKRPRFRYKIGGFVQVVFAQLKAFVPNRFYQFLLYIYYRL